MHTYFIGIDIGGTFTDCVMLRDDGVVSTAKTLSTHATTPAEGVMTGVGLLAQDAGLTPEDLLARTTRFSHGSTIGTNMVVERNGAKVALLSTRGHGDAFFMMRGMGRTAGLAADSLFDAHHERMPEPLVPRSRVLEITERITRDGSILTPLDEEAARADLTAMLAAGDIESVSIALLWSTVNPVHERRLREIVHEINPQIFVSLSSDVSLRLGEFERTSACVINSYVGPASIRYLSDLADRLSEGGLKSPLYVMLSSGGVLPITEAIRRPIYTIGSGPAGGLAGTVDVARRAGHKHVIATDMGGTSFEVGIIVNGQPTLARQQVIEKYTFYSTHLDLRSIACGGGSIAWVDPDSRSLRVGPQSAGSNPGPACYGRGTQPTVTDADIVLGLLDPDTFLGGKMQLDIDAARRAVGDVAEKLGLSLEEAAAGIVEVNAHAAAALIRQRTIEQGLDPREFTVYAFGGAGPVHAFAFANELGIERVIVPLGNGASTLSAYGAAVGDVIRSFEAPITVPSPFDPATVTKIIADLEKRARDAMAGAGETADVALDRVASMRYAGQKYQELNIHLPDGPVDAAFCAEIERRFTEEYGQLYSKAALALFQVQEIVNFQVTGRVLSRAASPVPVAGADLSAARTREVYWPGHGRQQTRIVRGAPPSGAMVEGPAIVELQHTSVSVAPGQRITNGDDGSLILHVA